MCDAHVSLQGRTILETRMTDSTLILPSWGRSVHPVLGSLMSDRGDLSVKEHAAHLALPRIADGPVVPSTNDLAHT